MTQEERYQACLKRYTTALRNGKPDMVPIRPFVAEFVAKYAGVSIQAATHDYRVAFEACLRCAEDFDWDAVVPNMIYVWTGLVQAVGLKYYGIPGLDLPENVAFQYKEPPEERAFMRPDEYDLLIANPTDYLLNVWLPRVSHFVRPSGEGVTREHNLALLKGGMAMVEYFNALGGLVQELRTRCGTVAAISGMLKAPLDILADKLRGYYGPDILNPGIVLNNRPCVHDVPPIPGHPIDELLAVCPDLLWRSQSKEVVGKPTAETKPTPQNTVNSENIPLIHMVHDAPRRKLPESL